MNIKKKIGCEFKWKNYVHDNDKNNLVKYLVIFKRKYVN